MAQATRCCNFFQLPTLNLEARYNNLIKKLAGSTFQVVNTLSTERVQSTAAKAGRVFAAFLLTATIVPLVGLCIAAVVHTVFTAIAQFLCGKTRPTPVELRHQPLPPAAADALLAPLTTDQPVSTTVLVQVTTELTATGRRESDVFEAFEVEEDSVYDNQTLNSSLDQSAIIMDVPLTLPPVE